MNAKVVCMMFTAALGFLLAQQAETISKPVTERERVRKEAQLKKS